MFVRFVVAKIDKSSGVRQGLFQAVGALRRSGDLLDADDIRLKEIGQWFSTNLKKPTRLARAQKPRSQERAICWFKVGSDRHLAMIREMGLILERYGLLVEMVTSSRIGYVVYEDEYQAAAEPFNDTAT